jgi:hypothetical protein
MARAKHAATVKGNLVTKRPAAKVKPKDQPSKVPLHIPANDYTDCHGRTYIHDPSAKAPYTGHSIRYPKAIDNEDIPFQIGKESDDINGASDLLIALALLKSLGTKDSPHIRAAKIFLEVGAKFLLAEDAIDNEIRKLYTPEQLRRLEVDFNAIKLFNAADTVHRLLVSICDKTKALGTYYDTSVAAYTAHDVDVSDEIEPLLKFTSNGNGKTT